MAIVQFDAVRTLNFSAITNAYLPLGSAVMQNWRVFKVTNDTDGNMLLSVNASTDQIFVPAFSFTLYDFATNAINVKDSDWFVLRQGTQFSIKYTGAAPTQGDVWIEGLFSTGV